MAANNDTMVNIPAAPGPDTPATRAPSALTRFLREVLVELKKTTWPTMNELVKFTVVVIVTIVVVAVFLAVADLILGRLAEVGFHIHTAPSQ